MKTSLIVWHLARFGSAGALSLLAGCSSTPTRQATSEFAAPSPAVEEIDGHVYERATPVQTVAPEYPVYLRRAGVTGAVMVECLIDQSGKVSEAKVLRADDKEFERPALEAVKRWTFKPGTRDGVAVCSRITVPINFGLND